MMKCLKLLEGKHDFSSFKAAGSSVSSTERVIMTTEITRVEEDTRLITVEANGFLRHMMRNIIGTLVDVGSGKLTEEGFSEVVSARNRQQAGMTAPARGLCLLEVRY